MANREVICTLSLYDDPNWIDPKAIKARAEIENNTTRLTTTLTGIKPFAADAMSASRFLLAVQTNDGLTLATLSAK